MGNITNIHGEGGYLYFEEKGKGREVMPITSWKITFIGPRDPLAEARDALADIAYDCGTLEAAQRRARDAIRGRNERGTVQSRR